MNGKIRYEIVWFPVVRAGYQGCWGRRRAHVVGVGKRERGLTIGDFLVPIRISERMHIRARHLALILIGFVLIGFVQAFVIGGALVAFGRDTEPLEPRTSSAVTLAAVVGLVAWLMFVYLNRPSRVRWTVFLATLLGVFFIALIVSVIAQPPA